MGSKCTGQKDSHAARGQIKLSSPVGRLLGLTAKNSINEPSRLVSELIIKKKKKVKD